MIADLAHGATSVVFLDEMRGYVVELADAAGALVSGGHRLYAVPGVRRPTEEELLFTVPLGPFAAALASWRPAQRLSRSIFYNVLRLPNGSVFFSFGRRMGVWQGGRIEWLTGMARPMRCLRGAIAAEPDGTLYIGEYDRNTERRSVRIYCLPVGSTCLEVVHEFEAGAIRHVHGLYRQPGSGRLWCTTGDNARECRILTTDDRFKTIDIVGMGDESWRAVSLAFSGSNMLYGTDAEFLQNHLYALDLRSGKRTCLAEMDGPVYYTAPLGRHHLFSVTAEGCKSQPVNQGTLWLATERLEIERIVSYPKDAWPKHFMYGTIHFALGSGLAQNRAYAFLHGLAGNDGRTILITARNQNRL